SPGIAQASATMIVGAPITIGSRSVGKDLQDQLTASLPVPAPAGNLTVTFTSDDPSRLVISSVQTAAGGASATVQVTAGQSVSPAVYLQALAGSGTVKVTASAIGYADGTSNVTLMPSGFYIFAPGIVSTFTTTTFAPNTQIFARSARLNANLTLSGTDQEVRGGLTVGFDIVSSLPSVGTITGPISFVGGTSFQKNTFFDPASSGTTILSFVTPAGFSTPTTFQTVSAIVDAPNVMLGATVSVGRDLQTTVTVQLQNAPPAGSPVDVTVTVAPGGEGTVALSKTASGAGTSSVTFTGVTTTVAGTIFVQGL